MNETICPACKKVVEVGKGIPHYDVFGKRTVFYCTSNCILNHVRVILEEITLMIKSAAIDIAKK